MTAALLPVLFPDHYEVAENGCWLWKGRPNLHGYGQVWIGGRTIGAHRLAYMIAFGLIPAGHEIDHTCHNDTACTDGRACMHRRCVNPDHLEPVTCRENLLRGHTIAAGNAAKTSCPHGHPYDDLNTGLYRGKRYCRVCRRAQVKKSKAARRERERQAAAA